MNRPPCTLQPIAHAVAVALLTLAALPSVAGSIDTGNPDLDLRLDTSIRYNLGVRTQGRDPQVYNNVHFDESDAKFDKGDVVTNRVDLLGELDVAWKRRLGAHISAAAWYDHAYRDSTVPQNPDLAAFPGAYAYSGNEYSSYTKRFYRG